MKTDVKNGQETPTVKHFIVPKKENALHFINDENKVDEFLENILGRHITPGKNLSMISSNLETSKMLLHNKELVQLLNSLDFDFLKLPVTGEDFLKYYFESKTNVFFSKTKRLVNKLKKVNNPSPELRKMLNYYDANYANFEKLESSNAKNIKAMLDNSFDLEGIVYMKVSVESEVRRRKNEEEKIVHSINFDIDKNLSKVSGYRHYYYGIRHDIMFATVPSYLNNKFCKFFGIYSLFQKKVDKLNEEIKKKFYQSHVVCEEEIPDSIIDDIKKWFRTESRKIISGKEESYRVDDVVAHALKDYPFLNLVYKLRYSSEGLSLELINANANYANLSKPASFDLNHEGFAEYAKNIEEGGIVSLSQKIKSIGVTCSTLAGRFSGSNVVAGIYKQCPFIFGNQSIPITFSEGKFKWSAYEAILKMPEISEVYLQISSFRSWMRVNLNQLVLASDIIDTMKKKTKEWKVPISIPRMILNTNKLAFDQLYPVQLIGRIIKKTNKPIQAKHIKPISFGNHYFNGNLTGLTGENAGGKTVCKETIILNLSLAHCGLPVLGTNFEFSPKSAIGSVFLEKGEGSTMQELAQKTHVIFNAIEKEGADNVLVIIDEVGSGTSPAAALIYGEMILKELYAHNVSVLFSTQFPELAEKLSNEGVATIFSMDEEHRIEKGIKSPDIKKFLKREKFDVKINIKTKK